MSIKLFLIFIIILNGLFGCKKTKLQGEYESIKGSWQWALGSHDDFDGSTTLDLKEKGKYKLYKKKFKIDHGRLILENNYLTFHSDKFDSGSLDKLVIKSFRGDSLIVTKIVIDRPYSLFKKK